MILDELRRRRVFRTIAAYVVACWVVIEAADVIFPYLSLPESAVRLVIIAAIIGFPVVVVLAWFFDITPEGIVRTPDRAESDRPARRVLGRWTDVVLLGLLALAVAYIVSERMDGQEGEPLAAGPRSIAVLPFADLSPDGDSVYLGDGIAETVLHTLARVDGLRVAARTSSFIFRDSREDIREIGEALNVDTVLEGSVSKDPAGRRMRVTAQLIDARNGFNLWSESYEGPVDDVFRIQDEIATAIARNMELTLLGDQPSPVAETTENVQAYELYLKGRNAAHERTEAGLVRALDFFEEATEVDPGYALAYTGLADTLSLLIDYGNERLDSVVPRVEALIDRAFELEPQLPEAWASLGLLRLQQGRYAAADEALSRSLSLDPVNDDALTWYGSVLLAQDRYRDALATYLRAYDRDPLSIPLNSNLGNLLSTMGRHVQAESHFRKLLELKPEDTGTYHNQLIQSAHARGDMAAATRWIRIELERDPLNLLAMFYQVAVYTDLGEFERALEWLERMEAMDPDDVFTLQGRSMWYVANGRFDDNLAYVREKVDHFATILEPYGVTLPPGLLAWLGSANYFAGDMQAAREAYDRALAFDGGISAPVVNETNQVWLPWMIRSYLALGLDAEATQLLEALGRYLEELLAAGIDTASAHAQHAQFLSLSGRREQALPELRAAAERGFRQTYYLDFVPDLAALMATGGGEEFRRLLDSYTAREREEVASLPPFEYTVPRTPPPISLAPQRRELYARRYRVENGMLVRIEDTNDGLLLSVPGQEPMLMHAATPTEFFFDDSTLRIEFVLDARDRVRHLLWHQYGDKQRGRPSVQRRERASYELDPMVLDDYLGRYALEGIAGAEMRMTRRDDMLYGALTGQPAIPYLPTGVDEFANDDVNATLRFRRDRNGRVIELTIRQEGIELRGLRQDEDGAARTDGDAG
ncbi:MAG: tetratricopeptide repeat protein [Gammaproteobacteria bacterium]